jgi:hypothetical protein
VIAPGAVDSPPLRPSAPGIESWKELQLQLKVEHCVICGIFPGRDQDRCPVVAGPSVKVATRPIKAAGRSRGGIRQIGQVGRVRAAR